MLLQGDLQSVFDALYHLGVIDPVLKMDWKTAIDDIPQHYIEIEKVIEVANTHQGCPEKLVNELKNFDSKSLSYLAMEVAREFADFHSCKNIH